MKIAKKILVGTVAALCFASNISYSFAEGVSIADVSVVDTRNITATLDIDIEADMLTTEEIKIMHDIVVSSVELDVSDAKKATVFLASELRPNTKYNLISVFGMDGSMDFEIGSILEAEEIMNLSNEGIKSINILDSKNLEVIYFDAITTNELELKLLEDMNIENIQAQSNSSIDVTTTSDLERQNSYIFMLLSVVGLEGTDMYVENGIYDFETSENITVATNDVVIEEPIEVVEEATVTIEDQTQNEDVVIETQEITEAQENGDNEEENEIDLNAAGESGGNLALDKNIDEVAATATEVPSTGTATSILILLTLGATAVVGFRRRK